ncbi:MAG TPA: glycosyltransferase family 39 protein [Gaiellaceae bacterium]|nr:glycosyltransferase family 39 protein [Gaiellaceae bacterium]
MSTVVLLGAGVAVAGTSALLANVLRLRSGVAFLLACFVLASVEVVSIALFLSIDDRLTRGALLAALGVTLVLSGAVWIWQGRPRPPLGRAHVCTIRRALEDHAVLFVTALAAGAYLYVLAVGLTVPQSLPDTMLYHLPRAAFWQQLHAVAYVPASPDERINVFPPGAEIQIATVMILGRGDRFVFLPQFLAVVAACLAIYGTARRLSFGAPAALFGASMFATFTVVLLQAPTALNDLVVASLLAISAFFATGRAKVELVLGALALGLAVATKGTVVFAVPALAVFALSSQPRRRWPLLCVAGLGGVLAGSFWFWVNRAQTGSLTGEVVLERGGQGIAERAVRTAADLLELSDREGSGLLASPIWSIGGLLACLVVAAVLVRAGKRRAAIGAALGGLVALCIVPTLVTWASVGYRAQAQLRRSLGLSADEVARLPDGFYESAMHSSYGAAFVLLYVAAGALVIGELRRRALPWAALAAVLAVPLTACMSVLLLGYDPQRMRYLTFSVALSASVFGVVLRTRMVAWIAATLALASVIVSVGYFIPRPAGLSILGGGTASSARWFVQAGGGAGDPDAFRFLAESVPADATVALALRRNTYVYPVWDAELRRTVLFVPADGVVPPSASWLVVGPASDLPKDRLAGWRRELSSPGGWQIYRRVGS